MKRRTIVAEGSVVFDQADQHASPLARRVELPHQDRILRRLHRLHKPNTGRTRIISLPIASRISLDTIVATNVQVTACDESSEVELHASRQRSKRRSRARLFAKLRWKNVRCFYSAVRVGVDQAERSRVGFLTPTFAVQARRRSLVDRLLSTLGRSPTSRSAATSTRNADLASAATCARAPTRVRISTPASTP